MISHPRKVHALPECPTHRSSLPPGQKPESSAANGRSEGRIPTTFSLLCERMFRIMHHGTRRARLAMSLLIILSFLGEPACAEGEGQMKFKRIRTQFIAALGDPAATSGIGAEAWGLWPVDPGPRGVRLENYAQLDAAGGVAPAQWKFDIADWWLEEHGLIMEKPDFPLPTGKYMVTGNREVTTMLTIHSVDQDGAHRWELDEGATLHEVTHLPCRSARYTPTTSGRACGPDLAERAAFPVTPGASMPAVEGCNKQDYAVLFVIGVAVDD